MPTSIPIEKLKYYNSLIENNPSIERKGKTTPYTPIKGHMFSFLSKDGTMGLRLHETDRKTFIEKFCSELMQQHGRIMKEYVSIPQSLLKETNKLSKYLQLSFNYVSQLKPKPIKKKKT